MKRSRFSDEQIIPILKEHEAGMPTADVCRRHGIISTTSWLGDTIIITSGRTRNWASKSLPRSPANGPGGMPPGPSPSHQAAIMKVPDSTSDW